MFVVKRKTNVAVSAEVLSAHLAVQVHMRRYGLSAQFLSIQSHNMTH